MRRDDPNRRLTGWKEIADVVGRSESWCRYMAKQGEPDRMPVWYFTERAKGRGTPMISVGELQGWIDKRKARWV